jgi:hypothetical protein
VALSQDETCKVKGKSVLQPTEQSDAETVHVDAGSSRKFKQVVCLSGFVLWGWYAVHEAYQSVQHCVIPILKTFVSKTNTFEALCHICKFVL